MRLSERVIFLYICVVPGLSGGHHLQQCWLALVGGMFVSIL